MPKMLIDLSQEDADKLKDYAAQHGQKVKPFVEYLVRMQIGSVPPPQVQPVKMQPAQAAPERIAAKSAPAQVAPERKPEQVIPVESRSQAQPGQTQPSAAPKKRDLSKFNEKVSAQVFTDGEEFMLNRFGKRTFYSTAKEAEAARDGNI